MGPDEFETLADLVAAGRDREGIALAVLGRSAPYSYRKFSTNVWKAGNLFGHYGVGAVGELAVAAGPKTADEGTEPGVLPERERGRIDAGEPLLAILGGTILGAAVDLAPAEPVDAPALVAPAHWEVEATPGCSRLAYGGPPADPGVVHFERSVWSENPVEPPEPVEPGDDALRFDDDWTHAELLAVVSEVVAEYGIGADTRVVLAAEVTEPGGFVAGVLAPLAVGATVVVPESAGDEARKASEDGVAETLVVGETRSETVDLPAEAVTRSLRDTRRA